MAKENEQKWTTVSITAKDYTLEELMNFNYQGLFSELERRKQLFFYMIALDITNHKIHIAVPSLIRQSEQVSKMLRRNLRHLYLRTKFTSDEIVHLSKQVTYSTLKVIDEDFPLQTFPILNKIANYHLGIEISKLIVKLLVYNRINENTLLLYSIYLQLGWIKARLITDNESIQEIFMKGYYGGLARCPETENLIDGYDKVFHQNSIFLEIYTLVFDEENKSEIPEWLAEWIEKCCLKLHQNRRATEHNRMLYEAIHYLTPQLINQQLGLSSGLLIAQNHFLTKMAISRCDLKLLNS